MEKGTGIIRRVDDLGRIVIPRDIRRSLGITEGTPMELFVGENGEVIFKKYLVKETLECSVQNLEDVFFAMEDNIAPAESRKVRSAIQSVKDAVRDLDL